MESKKEEFVQEILNWFQSNRRSFSWRSGKLTPFQLLIAELMLQKTGANQVERIFPKFIQDFPDARSIARIPEEKLGEIFHPLGLFNRRARDLKKLAQVILENGNEVPNTEKGLINLPGIGEYIANAILCFGFSQKVPIVDANVARVFKRVFSFPVKGAPSRDKSFAAKISEIIPNKGFKDFNYALLDFAAAICLPRKPLCETCIVSKMCDLKNNLKVQ